jgi:hypothetical protein
MCEHDIHIRDDGSPEIAMRKGSGRVLGPFVE